MRDNSAPARLKTPWATRLKTRLATLLKSLLTTPLKTRSATHVLTTLGVAPQHTKSPENAPGDTLGGAPEDSSCTASAAALNPVPSYRRNSTFPGGINLGRAPHTRGDIRRIFLSAPNWFREYDPRPRCARNVGTPWHPRSDYAIGAIRARAYLDLLA